MATVTTDLKGRDLRTVCPAYRGDGSIGGPEVVEVTYNAVDYCSTANNYGATSDIFEVMTIPKNSWVFGVQVLLDTGAATPDVVEGGTSTINIGDTGSATRFDTGRNMNAVANAIPYPTGTWAAPQYYTADDKLRIAVATGTLKKARFRIRVLMFAFGAA